MRQVSYSLSAILALLGIACSVMGILSESFKTAAVGIVLIFGAGVFATLYLGSRRDRSLPD